MRPIRTIAILPTLFTLGNLVCGFFAIVVASRVAKPVLDELTALPLKPDPQDAANCMFSAWLIFLAMVFDALDGYVARLSRTASDFGAELDSLCDLVTFGVAPAFLVVKMCPEFAGVHRYTAWVIAASYAICAALRLARFNVETSDDDEHLHFSGLPSPAAAASIAGFAIMFYTLRKEDNPMRYVATIDTVLQTMLPFFAVLVALLMVSRIPYPHVVNQIFRGQRSFGHLIAVIFSLVAVMVVWHFAVPLICAAFVLYGPIRFAWEKAVEHRHQEETIF
jgi:CDP-diacylglycerol---serine O-phosphatidyltransferase